MGGSSQSLKIGLLPAFAIQEDHDLVQTRFCLTSILLDFQQNRFKLSKLHTNVVVF